MASMVGTADAAAAAAAEGDEESREPFGTPVVYINPEGWGPTTKCLPEQFLNVPFAPFGKGDRLGKAADFTQSAHYQARQQKYRSNDQKYSNTEFQYKHDAQEDQSFHLVDTAKAHANRGGFKNLRRPWQNRGGARGRWGDRGRGGRGDTGGRGWGSDRGGRGGSGAGRDPAGGMGRGGGRGNEQRRGGRGGWGNRYGDRRGQYQNQRADRQASVKVLADWNVLDEIDLAAMVKLAANPPKVEDILWCGALTEYDETYDRLTTRNEKPLRRIENREFYYVTTTDDPVIEKLAVQGVGTVYATDHILAHLMASPRSVYPWDIVVQKLGDKLFFDKRDSSQFDYLTVSETSHDPPQPSEDVDNINTPERLSLEATMINQNFSQQILRGSSPAAKVKAAAGAGEEKGDAPPPPAASYTEAMEMPNPFFDESEAGEGVEPAQIAYRYRKFALGDHTIVVRTEVHGVAIKRGEKQTMTAFALNEWDSKLSGGVDWRQKIDAQSGAVLATELKNNSAKLAKWTAQSLLAGVDQMKIGYVTRASRTNPYDHSIIGTKFFKPREFATQITLNTNNTWGIVKFFVDKFMAMEDGKYVIVKDPNKPTIRIYAVPPNTFEDEEEDEEDDEDEGEGEDEDS